jgi:hypothetical protein
VLGEHAEKGRGRGGGRQDKGGQEKNAEKVHVASKLWGWRIAQPMTQSTGHTKLLRQYFHYVAKKICTNLHMPMCKSDYFTQ